MTKLAGLALALMLSMLPTGCGKSGPAGAAALSGGEKSLFSHLPADAQVVFGFQYKDLAAWWENSPIKAIAAKYDAESDLLNNWMDCSGDLSNAHFAGTLTMGSETRLRLMMSGISADALEKCAKEIPGVTVEREDGGKYLGLKNMPSANGNRHDVGYYLIDDTTLYFTMSMADDSQPLGEAEHTPTDLAGFKADLASAKQKSVLDNAATAKLVEKIDRGAAMWFCGNAAGTPAAEYIREGCVSIGVAKTALVLDFFAEVKQAEMAEMAMSQFERVKSRLDFIPEEMKSMKDALSSVLGSAKLSRDGNVLTGHFDLDNDAIMPLIYMASGFGSVRL
jgi:hypothetical protein